MVSLAGLPLGGLENRHPRGESGVLKAIELSNVLPADRCFLHIDHGESSYMGCLLIDDEAFCRHIVKLLQRHLNRPIAETGALDMSHTL